MKKIIFILFFIILNFNPAYSNVVIKSISGTIISSNQIMASIQLIEDSYIERNFSIKLRALDLEFYNTSYPQYKIPINKLYLNDGVNEFQIQTNTDMTLFSLNNCEYPGYSKNYNCILKNIGVLPPGTYSTRLQFQTQIDSCVYTTIYNLCFTIPLNQDVSCITNPVNITLTPENVFDVNASISNTTSPQILIKSNDKWKLILDTSNLGNLIGKYYFQITGVSSNVTDYETSKLEILPNRQYVIARGKPTTKGIITDGYCTDFVNIKYSLQNTSDRFLKEGKFNNYINYIIGRD